MDPQDAHLVLEMVPEDLELKRRVFKEVRACAVSAVRAVRAVSAQ
jgi:3-hydroxyacyl-CoA dehydrogenase